MILVTAPTSTVGRDLVENLLAADESLRLVVRDPTHLEATVRERAEIVTGSHGDPNVIDTACRGADAVFWLAPTIHDAPTVAASFADFSRPAAQAFTRHGVGRVVAVSALGRGTPVADRAGLVTASLQMDDLLGAAGVPFRAVACASLMRNFLHQVPAIRQVGALAMTLDPERRGPLVTSRDVAGRCRELLLDESWTGSGEIACLGPEDLSPNQIAAIISTAIGREIAYTQITDEALREQLLSTGHGPAMAQGTVDMSAAKNAGLDAGVKRTAATRNPTTFEQWCGKILAPALMA